MWRSVIGHKFPILPSDEVTHQSTAAPAFGNAPPVAVAAACLALRLPVAVLLHALRGLALQSLPLRNTEPILTSPLFQTGEALFSSWQRSKVAWDELNQSGSNSVGREIATAERRSPGSPLFLRGVSPKLILGANRRAKAY